MKCFPAFTFEKDPMYTKRERELIQQHLQKSGRLSTRKEDIDDLFYKVAFKPLLC